MDKLAYNANSKQMYPYICLCRDNGSIFQSSNMVYFMFVVISIFHVFLGFDSSCVR